MPVLHMETDSVRSTGQALGSAAAILADQMSNLKLVSIYCYHLFVLDNIGNAVGAL